jgi:sugar phosphate permease
MINDRPAFWFPAKTRGWGWGPPNCWQGWLVICGYVLMVLAAVRRYSVAHQSARLFATLVALTVVLIGIIALKGERPDRRRRDNL